MKLDEFKKPRACSLQVPMDFTTTEPFRPGETRTIWCAPIVHSIHVQRVVVPEFIQERFVVHGFEFENGFSRFSDWSGVAPIVLEPGERFGVTVRYNEPFVDPPVLIWSSLVDQFQKLFRMGRYRSVFLRGAFTAVLVGEALEADSPLLRRNQLGSFIQKILTETPR